MGLRGSAPRRGMSAAARRVPTRSAPCIPHGLRAQDAGNASPSAVGIVLVVAVLLCTIAAGARIAMARAQARTAADMSALAAADAYWNEAAADPCGIGSAVARTNAGAVESCEVIDMDVAMEVSTATGVPFVERVSARARAGPRRCDEVDATRGASQP